MISLAPGILNEIQSYAENAYPEEGAGVLIGREQGGNRVVERVLPLTNKFEVELRNRRYMITPEDMINAEEFADEMGLEIIGIYHSHPDHPAQPSEFDHERALPWYSYIITSVNQKTAAESRSWRLTEERIFREEKLLLEQKNLSEEK
jgi:proteasome lid subunit RPN8/RPN11